MERSAPCRARAARTAHIADTGRRTDIQRPAWSATGRVRRAAVSRCLRCEAGGDGDAHAGARSRRRVARRGLLPSLAIPLFARLDVRGRTETFVDPTAV